MYPHSSIVFGTWALRDTFENPDAKGWTPPTGFLFSRKNIEL